MSELPNLSDLLDRANLLLFQMQRYSEAEVVLQQCLALDPQHAPTYALLAINRANLRQGELAIESAKKAIELAPDESYPYYALAIAYRYHGRITRSERAIATAIEIHPEIPDYLATQADNYIIQSQYTQALDLLKVSLEIDPEHIYSLLLKLRVFVKLRLLVDAELVADCLLKLAPNDADIYRSIGNLYQQQNKQQQAIAAYQESMRLNPLQSDLHAVIQVCLDR
jgi:tetratricopeptide (TPR) repeat protein